MCCILSLLLLIGPRIAGIAWYLTDLARWNAAFSSILWPIAGLIFLPWTTMAWVFMSSGGVNGLDWIVIALAFLLDIGAFGGGGYSRRHRD